MEQGQLIWITGFSGVGKTTIATNLYRKLKQRAKNWVLIDGDCVRQLCNHDLGYSMEDRLKNAKRISNLCKMLTDQGINVIASTISMFTEIYAFNAQNITNYKLVLIKTDIENIRKRDNKGLYKRATDNCPNLVGVNQKYDVPPCISLTIDNNEDGYVDKKADMILKLIEESNNG